MRSDFEQLLHLAKENSWDDNTTVSVDLLGPLWPPRREPKWSKEGRKWQAQYLDDSASNDPEVLKKKLKALRGEKDQLTELVSKAQSKVESLENDKSQLERDKTALETQKTTLEDQKTELEKGKTQLEVDKTELAQQIRHLDDRRQVLREDFEKVHNELLQAQTQAAELVAKFEQAKVAAAEAEAARTETDHQLADISARLNKATSGRERAKELSAQVFSRVTFWSNIGILILVIGVITYSVSEIACRQGLMGIVDTEISLQTAELADLDRTEFKDELAHRRNLIRTFRRLRTSISTLIQTGGSRPDDSIEQIRKRYQQTVLAIQCPETSSLVECDEDSEDDRNQDLQEENVSVSTKSSISSVNGLVYRLWTSWKEYWAFWLALCTTNSLLAVAVMGSGALGSMADAMRQRTNGSNEGQKTQASIAKPTTETTNAELDNSESNPDGTEKTPLEPVTTLTEVKREKAADKIDQLFDINAVFLGLVAGFITYLVLKSGKQIFLVHGDPTATAFNPFASALAGLVAGLFTDRAYRLLSKAVDEFYKRCVAVMQMGPKDLKSKDQ